MNKTGHIYLLNTVLLLISLILWTSCRNGKDQAGGFVEKTAGSNWKIIGPGAGGGVFIPTISPFDTGLVFAKGDMTGDFVTYDGGKSWQLFNLMSVVQDYEFDPADPDVVYASSRGYLYDEDRGSGLSMLYRSDNRGKTWKVIYPDLSRIGPLEKLQSLSFTPSGLLSGLPDGSIDIIRVDPLDNKRIFLGLSPLKPYIGKLPENAQKKAFIMGSEDEGKEWSLLAQVPGTEVLGIFTAGPDQVSHELTVVTDSEILKINTETSVTREMPFHEGRILKAMGGSGTENKLIYVVTNTGRKGNGELTGGVFRSYDGGEKWEKANGNLDSLLGNGTVPLFMCIGVCGKKPQTAYLSVYTPAYGQDRISMVRYEIYKTDNEGRSWKVVYSANAREVLTGNFNGSWLNRDYGPGWGGDVLSLGVAPGNPDICYATDYGQIYKTSDGGLTWDQVSCRNNSDGSVSSRGIDITCCYGVILDPFDRNHLIVSYIDIGLFHSFDRGKSWVHLVEGIPDEWVNTCYDVIFDPDVKGRLWSTWSNKHSLPRQSQFGDGLFQGYSGGVAYSEDGGKSWKKRNSGLPANSICTEIMIDPDSPENSRTLYLSTFNQGVFKSSDNGKTWISSGKGLKDNRYGWEIRMAGKRLYLLCVRGWKDDNVINGKLYFSDDQAVSWNEAALPAGVTAPSDLMVDPVSNDTMYLSCWPKHENGRDICGGLYMTVDGGKSWKQSFDERIRVFAAARDPFNPRTLFINTFQNGAYYSTDLGQSWNRIMGYRFKWGHCPVPDPDNPGMLFLTTYGVSVCYGPAFGTEEEFGKIENIPDSWW